VDKSYSYDPREATGFAYIPKTRQYYLGVNKKGTVLLDNNFRNLGEIKHDELEYKSTIPTKFIAHPESVEALSTTKKDYLLHYQEKSCEKFNLHGFIMEANALEYLNEYNGFAVGDADRGIVLIFRSNESKEASFHRIKKTSGALNFTPSRSNAKSHLDQSDSKKTPNSTPKSRDNSRSALKLPVTNISAIRSGKKTESNEKSSSRSKEATPVQKKTQNSNKKSSNKKKSSPRSSVSSSSRSSDKSSSPSPVRRPP